MLSHIYDSIIRYIGLVFIPTHHVDSYLWALQFPIALVILSFYVYSQVYGHLMIKLFYLLNILYTKQKLNNIYT